MTRTEAKAFHDEMNAALAPIFAKYHLQIKKNNVTFGEKDVKISITTEQLDEAGNHKSTDVEEYLLRAHLESKGAKNIPDRIIGAKFRIIGHNDIYTITGYNGRAQSYPIEFKSSRGAQYKGKGTNIIFL